MKDGIFYMRRTEAAALALSPRLLATVKACEHKVHFSIARMEDHLFPIVMADFRWKLA
jgi:hypothetical protein